MSIDLNWDERPQYVYVYWRDDEPLYVGVTSNPSSRLTSHRGSPHDRDATHIDVWSVGDDRAEAEAIETAAIRALDPLHNTYQSPRANRRRDDWAKYCEWLHIFNRGRYAPDEMWALDPVIAGPICEAVGYDFAAIVAARDAAFQELNDSMRRAVTFAATP